MSVVAKTRSPLMLVAEHDKKMSIPHAKQDMMFFARYLVSKGCDSQQPEEHSPEALNTHLSGFLVCARKPGGENYEPSSLRTMFNSIVRYLKSKNYPCCPITDPRFEKTRLALRAKQKNLKSLGLGAKPNATRAITDTEVDRYSPELY